MAVLLKLARLLASPSVVNTVERIVQFGSVLFAGSWIEAGIYAILMFLLIWRWRRSTRDNHDQVVVANSNAASQQG